MPPLMYAALPYDYKRGRWAGRTGDLGFLGWLVSLVSLLSLTLWFLSSKGTFRDY